MEAVGGRDGRTDRLQDAWLLMVAGNGTKPGLGSIGFFLASIAACTQDLPPSPALISDHRPSTDITIPHSWVFPRLPSSSSPTASLSDGIIADGPNRLLFPIHPLVYRPENSRIHPPGVLDGQRQRHSRAPTVPDSPRPHPVDLHPRATSNNTSHSHRGTVLLARRRPVADLGPSKLLRARVVSLVSLAHDIQAGLYIPAFPVPSIYTRRPQIGTPYPFPSPARASPRAQCPRPRPRPRFDNLQPATAPASASPSDLKAEGRTRLAFIVEDSALRPSLASCGLPVPSDLLAISDSTTRNARVWPDPPETLASDAVCGQIEGVVPDSPKRTAPPHRPRASSVASENLRSLLRLLPPKHRSQRSTLPRPPCCVVV